jgi:uncharacterized membrane protein SirB2
MKKLLCQKLSTLKKTHIFIILLSLGILIVASLMYLTPPPVKNVRHEWAAPGLTSTAKAVVF